MLRIEFKKEEIDKIRSLNKTHLHPFVRQKSNVLLLKANNISHGLIAQICDISENTLRNYFRGYMESGIESLTEIPFYKRLFWVYYGYPNIICYKNNHSWI